MDRIRIAQVGCGGMGLRHIYGHIELQRMGFDTFDMVALCDRHTTSAEHVASEFERATGKRPKVYADFEEMLEKEPGLEAISITTDTRAHHSLCEMALEAGKHVSVEKPMGLTVRACHRMMASAERAGKVLSVAENFRRDPINRLVKALLDKGAIGAPRLVITVSARGGADILQSTGWRHSKTRGGYFLDYGVHETDLLHYFLGDWKSVFAETHLWETVRQASDRTGLLDKFYAHRVEEDAREGRIVATGQDTVMAVTRYTSGVMGSISMSWAAHGEATNLGIIYGDCGSIQLPHSRSGKPMKLTPSGASEPLSEQQVLDLVPDFELDDTTAAFYGKRKRLASYDKTFPQADAALIAIEMQDFANAIRGRSQPEVDGTLGLKAVAKCYAVLESGLAGLPVSVADVEADKVCAYQEEINRSVGL